MPKLMSRETLKALEEAQSAAAATPRGQDDADFMAAVALTLHAERTHGGALGEAYEKLRGNATALDAGTQAQSIARAHIDTAILQQQASAVAHRAALFAEHTDSFIKTFSAHYKSASASCIVGHNGASADTQQNKFKYSDASMKGCAAKAADIATAFLSGGKMPTTADDFQEVVRAAKHKSAYMLRSGAATQDGCGLTQGGATADAGVAANAVAQCGPFWELAGHADGASVTLKLEASYHDARTKKPTPGRALAEQWQQYTDMKRTLTKLKQQCTQGRVDAKGGACNTSSEGRAERRRTDAIVHRALGDAKEDGNTLAQAT
uniref:Trypanosoma vivax n=1 Tax=Trypanosoma vivax (strain Y486) TaxID=1055687 RepID=G0UBD7_TRYVY|nr:Trypanosoma vivax [Trypanosoma vivax Y486]